MAKKKKAVNKKRAAKKTSTGTRPSPKKKGASITAKAKKKSGNTSNEGAADPDKPVFHNLQTANTESQAVTDYQGAILPEFKQVESGPGMTKGIEAYSSEQRRESGERALPPVDAWFGSFGTRVSSTNMAMRMGQSEFGAQEMIAEVIIGNDDRQQVHDTRQYPFGCLCSLAIVSSSNRRYVGTGWLINPTTVVTAGHCVYMHNEGGWAKSIGVYPGRNGPDKPIERFATGLFSVQGWLHDKQPSSDYAAIKLNAPVEDIGSYGYQVATDSELMKYNCHVVGYPADKPGTMWGHVRRLKEVRPKTIIYDIDTYGGNSGGPVFVVLNNRVLSLGIHNYGDLSGNSATRITDKVFENLEKWKKDQK